MTKLSDIALGIRVDELMTENTDQGVSGADANEICIDLLDSKALKASPVQYHELNIMVQDLDANNQIDITHALGSVNLDIVLYNHEGKRIYTPYFDFQTINTTTVRLTIYSGIPYKRSFKGFIYLVA